MQKINVDVDNKIVHISSDEFIVKRKSTGQVLHKAKTREEAQKWRVDNTIITSTEVVGSDQEDPGLEQKISMKEKELVNAKAELKSTSAPEAVLSQQEKILNIQHEIGELKDQLKDLNQK